jgi:glutathione S-transferase
MDHNDRQVVSGLRFLDGLASRAGDGSWLAGTEQMSQADISSVVAYTFAKAVRRHLDLRNELPNLAQFASRCEGLPIFRSVPLPEAIS